MGNISLFQLIILIFICTLAFGDIPKISSAIKKSLKNYKKLNNKNRKKGS